MTYMIKHPINATPFKIACIYNSSNYTISAGIKSVQVSLNTIQQTSGMRLTLSANSISLVAGKTYLIYYKMGFSNATENRGGTMNIRKNGVVITDQPVVNAVTTATAIGSTNFSTPINIATALITASSGDVIDFLYNRNTGSSIADTVNTATNAAFILEV